MQQPVYRLMITKPTGMKSPEAIQVLGFTHRRALKLYMTRSNEKHREKKTATGIVAADLVERTEG